MKFELPPPIPAKRYFPAKVQPPSPRNEASPAAKPLPVVSSPSPPQAPPLPPSPPASQASQKIQPPDDERAGKSAEAGEPPSPVTDVVPAPVHARSPKPRLPKTPAAMSATRWRAVLGIATLVITIIAVMIYSIILPIMSVTSSTVTPKEDQKAPRPWKEVRTEPTFAKLSPEEQLIRFDRWYKETFPYVSTLPNWKEFEDDFNKGAAKTRAELRKAAGGVTPDQARVKVATQAITAKQAEAGPVGLTENQIGEILRALGEDIAIAYYQLGQLAGSPAPASSVPAFDPDAYIKEKDAMLTTATPAPLSKAEEVPTPSPQTFRVVNIGEGDTLNLRQGPGSSYPVVVKIPPGFRGITLGARRFANGTTIWREISAGGYAGYVNEEYLEAEKAVR
jgi:hypothetical protein